MAIHEITPEEVQARIAKGETVDLIDVRTTSEWHACHAVGARHVPLSGLDPVTVMSTRIGKTDDPLYVICASGARSASACAAFHRAGFIQAVNVQGGTSAWTRAGLPVQRNPAAAGLGLLKQVGVLAIAAAAVLFLAPCSPLSVWGSAYCPTTPAATTTTGMDFAGSVVEASRTQPVLVDFNATWCGPCRQLAPELAALEQARGDRLQVVSIDVDQQPAVAQSQGVSSIPDLRLWQDGQEVARMIGYRPQAEIAAWIDQHTKEN